MKHIAVGQRERTTVVTRSQIDKIYTNGFKDGVRKMQEMLKATAVGFPEGARFVAVGNIDQIAEDLLDEGDGA